jgi:hypothetical protein
MPAQNDFALTVDRAASLLVDATCSARAAIAGPLPRHLDRLIRGAIVDLDRAQQKFFQARNNPWEIPTPPKQRQLELL